MKLGNARGQGLIEYVVLLGLLGLVAGGTAVVVGPGVGNVYSQVVALGGGEATAPGATALPEAGTPTPTDTPTIQCATIAIAGSATFRDLNNDGRAETVRFGGLANCSQVTGTGIAGDPLASSASQQSLRCVSIDPITLDLQYAEGGGSVTYKVASGPATLVVREKRNGATFLTATLSFGELVISTRSGTLSATVSGVSVDNSIRSPTLDVFKAAPASQAGFTLPDTSRVLTLDSQSGQYRLVRRSANFTASLATACGR